MSSSMNTILIIGGSGGIGESFSRRFHKMGKKVIVTGRRQNKLDELKSSCDGLETYVMDMTDLNALPDHVATLTNKFPEIDTVWINGGIQYSFKFNDSKSHSDDKVKAEIDTNVTAPIILARYFVPFLLEQTNATNFMITSSGLAFVPMGVYPVYCPTKAFVHSFMVGLRQQMKETKLNIIELAPPKVDTDLEAAHKGAGSGVPSLSLQEYTDMVFEVLDGNKAEDLKEVAVGFAANGAGAWRGSIGKILENMKLGG